jgi:hypothetical protein
MQVDEALGKVTDPEVKAFLENIIRNQNSYTTKLETQLKDLSSKNNTPNGTGVDSITAKYLEKNMRRDVIAEAETAIKKDISVEVFNAVQGDWLEFLDKAMSKEKTTVDFAVDAFSLIYGRCMRKKDHPVNQIGKAATPSGTPDNKVATGTNEQAIQGVQNILKQQPPVMTGSDANASTGMPTPGEVQVKNTRDAFASLKSRFAQNGGNKFQ